MTTKVVLLYLVVLFLGAGVGVGHSFITEGAILFPDVILTALLYAILGLMVLVTAHFASMWGVDAPDIDLDI